MKNKPDATPPLIIRKLLAEEQKLRNEATKLTAIIHEKKKKMHLEIEKLTTTIHENNTRRHEIKESLRIMNKGKFYQKMKVRGESWEDIVLRIIKNHKAPITQAELYQQIQEECPQFSEKQISANIYHKMFVLRKAQQVVRLRKDNSPGNYYVLTEFPKSKLAGFTRVG